MTFYQYIKSMNFPDRVVVGNWRKGNCLCVMGAVARDMGYKGQWSRKRHSGLGSRLHPDAQRFLQKLFKDPDWLDDWGFDVIGEYDDTQASEPTLIDGEDARRRFLKVINDHEILSDTGFTKIGDLTIATPNKDK